MKAILSILVLLFVGTATAENVFRIEYDTGGSRYKSYTNDELRRRVWELERAVAQLQSRVFHLEGTRPAQPAVASWVCKIKVFGNVYSAVGGSKAVASHEVTEKCSKGEKGGFHCKNPTCEQ